MKFAKISAITLAAAMLLSSCTGGSTTTPTGSTPASTPPAATTSTTPATTSTMPSTTPSATTSTTPAPAAKKDIVIAINNNFITLDPHAGRDSLGNTTVAAMNEGLVQYNDKLELVPCLAEKFTVSDDALTYTFNILKGVKFHDGEPLNAEAVKVNIDRVMNPDKALRQARAFIQAKEIKVVDEYTLQITLKQPYMAFLSRLESFKIISPKAIKEHEDSLGKMAIGTGQFMFKEWVEGDHMTMVKNPDWRNAADIGVDSVTYKFVPENGSRVAMLETGEADVIYPMPSEMVEKIKSNPKIDLEIKDSTVCRYVTMNQLKPPFDNVKVRQALNYAIDKQAFIKVVKGGYGAPLNSAMSPVLPFYADHTPYEYDVEKAKALLKEAGYPDGFTATIWGNNETETVKGMNFINQQLSLIGVKLEVVPMEEGTLSDKVYKTTPETAELQMWYVSWSASDPDNAIRSTFESTMVPPAGANTNYYNSKVLDEAIANGNKAVKFEDQYKYYKEAQDTIWNDAVWMFMGVDQTVFAKSKNVDIHLGANGGGIEMRKIGVK